MRNVMVSGWKKQEDGRQKFEELGIAIFHQFGVDYEEFENGAANYSTAIIEYADGRMGNVRVEYIRFLSPNVELSGSPGFIGESGSNVGLGNWRTEREP